eukprot:g39795.t1
MNVTQESYFLKSALPTDAPVSTLAMPSDTQLDRREHRAEQKSMRVQEQVRTMLRSSSNSSRVSSVYGGSVSGVSCQVTLKILGTSYNLNQYKIKLSVTYDAAWPAVFIQPCTLLSRIL